MCVRVLEKKEKMCCLAIVHDAIKLGLSRDSRISFFFFFSLAVFVKQNATSGWTSAPSVMVALRRPLFFTKHWPIRAARRCAVVVGGDMARSPRMQYHACSLRRLKGTFRTVALVGLDEGNRLCAELEQLEKTDEATIDQSHLLNPPEVPRHLKRLGWIATTLFRVVSHFARFSNALLDVIGTKVIDGGMAIERCSLVIVQTPPAVPFVPLVLLLTRVQYALECSWYYTVLLPLLPFVASHHQQQASLKFLHSPKRATVIIDWHNLGYTLLAIDNRPRFVVTIYRWCEQYLCSFADFNVTVSCAMRKQLTNTTPILASSAFSIDPRLLVVLPDSAPRFFAPCSRSTFLSEVVPQEKELSLTIPSWITSGRQRSLIVVSSTSWTADDDYSMVVKALSIFDGKLKSDPTMQDLRVWLVVTGKGASRKTFEEQVRQAKLSERIAVSTVYFQSYAAYAKMLGASDVGLCVHQSSSGLDLPMKCVDMFGCGLPVIALEYPALSELVNSETGWMFSTAEELSRILMSICPGIGGDLASTVLSMRRNVLAKHSRKWDESWDATLKPTILKFLLA